MFEKVSVIPYAIRQFCKLIYKLAMEKFEDEKSKGHKNGIRLVAHFLLKNWLLRACF